MSWSASDKLIKQIRVELEQLSQLTFRHVFRQAYTFEIRWDKMKPMVSGCEAAFKRLSDELSARFNLSRNP